MPFADILGQDGTVSRLQRAWISGRLAQAYCFAGPPGVGKRATAWAVAQAVNCLAPVDGQPGAGLRDACGTCNACRKIAGRLHPDVMEMRPEGKTVITIDQIRELTAWAALRPYEGRTKVCILDPAELMQEPAANAFLKTLEEPSGSSLFILVTTAPTALLPTIRSRCQELRFTALGEIPLREILVRHGRTAGEAAAAAAFAGGSVERALALDLAQARATRDRVLREVWEALGSLPALLESAEGLARDRAGFEAVLETLTGFTRDLAMIRVLGDVAPLVHADRRAELVQLATRYPLQVILQLFEAQADAQRALAHAANPRYAAERMLLRMRRAVEARGGR